MTQPLKPLSPSRPAPKPAPREGRAKGQKGASAPDMSLDKRSRRNAKARGKYAEERIALRLGGRQTISSGSGILEKGDVHVDDLNLFVEVKYCGVRQGKGDTQVTFDREWLEKTILDAEAAHMLPVVALRFRDGTGAYATTAEVFERLIAQIRAQKEPTE